MSNGKGVVILPGFPTSAVFTFHEFVAPVIRLLAGCHSEDRVTVEASLPMRVNSERGRTEYMLVGLVRASCDQTDKPKYVAYPMGKGSGSVTTFSAADGFITTDQHTEIREAGETVRVSLIGSTIRAPDLVVLGSHCTGLDVLLDAVVRRGFTVKSMHIGSTGGLQAASRGECDIAGIHLLDEATDEYNAPFLNPDVELLTGYGRQQGVVFRPEDERFLGKAINEVIHSVTDDNEIAMVSRNAGSGTRVLIDGLLQGQRPAGYSVQVKSHNAVAAAVTQCRADWGVAIKNVADTYGLGFLPLREERYDFAIPKSRRTNPAVLAFRDALASHSVRNELRTRGFIVDQV